MFVLLVSPQDRPGDHLRALEAVVRTMRNEDFVRQLRACQTADEIWALLERAAPGGDDASGRCRRWQALAAVRCKAGEPAHGNMSMTGREPMTRSRELAERAGRAMTSGDGSGGPRVDPPAAFPAVGCPREGTGPFRRVVQIVNPLGLHQRVADRFCRAAKQYASRHVWNGDGGPTGRTSGT